MSVLVFSDAQTAAAAAATLLGGMLIEKPSLVLGVDCAQELVPTFQSLRAMTANGLLSWGIQLTSPLITVQAAIYLKPIRFAKSTV